MRRLSRTELRSVALIRSSLILPGGASLTTENGDVWECESDANGNWRVVSIQKNSAPGRGKLTANRTYYVRTDGNDTNDGLANTAGGAFLTIQKAINVVYGALDLGGFDVVIQVGAGTYGAGVSITSAQVGAGKIILRGDVTTPSNVVIDEPGNAVYASNYAAFSIEGFKLKAAVGGGLTVELGAQCNVTGKMDFGACGSAHVQAMQGGTITSFVNYSITGSAPSHLYSLIGGRIRFQIATITISGTLAFGSGFARADDLSLIYSSANTYSGGTVTGPRYWVTTNSQIYTGGGGANYFPGNATGTASSGGLYS
ncbi:MULTISPECIES: hypothetical protein [unclassified Afipia]|uniref:hypothetical protein n=1 Tax=unclassified Afipia TaxID=2642050 RepID=UPI0004677408|nr:MULTISPECIES: hypothetical protein [unclassified Afipia]